MQANTDCTCTKLEQSKPVNRGKGKQVAAASATKVIDSDNLVEVHTVAATMGCLMWFKAEKNSYLLGDSYVSPVSCASLPWSTLASGMDKFPTPVSTLLDCGS